MHDHRPLLDGRLRRELRERIRPAEVLSRHPLTAAARALPGEPLPAAEALALGDGAPVSPGDRWGRPWGTTWFHISGAVPESPAGLPCTTEVVVDLGFTGPGVGFSTEGAIYRDGRIVCGVHPRRRAVPLAAVSDGEHVDFHVEAASNPDFSTSFRPNPLGDPATAGDSPLYVFGGAWVVGVATDVRRLSTELGVLGDLLRSLPTDDPRHHRLARGIEMSLDAIDPADVPSSATAALAVLEPALAEAGRPGRHRASAIGHAHIDTAWLWPLRETRRKCARTFANVVQLASENPGYRFACSQAVQYEWIRTDHPDLFDAIRATAERGQWVPVGGMWVEADMNLPSGESLVRQMVHGQRWFEQHMGARCTEVWIPDVFGYPGNLPQIFAAGGCTRFVTQKLSWNRQNRFPHHTFTWEGIDGSRVLAHFPPVETYNAEIRAAELRHAEATFRDHAWSRHSLVPFGHGDGGGGPTREMLWRAALLADLDGVPELAIESPAEFFERVEGEALSAGDAVPVWRGELYFEMHRGTFTSQVRTKVGNRRCEGLLREVELWAATTGRDDLAGELDALWKEVLVQQFHDILPGSSIAWVHADAEAAHERVARRCEELLGDVLDPFAVAAPLVANASTHPRSGVVVGAAVAGAAGGSTRVLADGRTAAWVSVPGLSVVPLSPTAPPSPVTLRHDPDGSVVMDNGLLRATVDTGGSLRSLVDLRHDREVVPHGADGARLTLAPDTPVEYDAWDLEQWTSRRSRPLPPPGSVSVVADGPVVAALEVVRTAGSSSFAQTFELAAGSPRLDVHVEVDWAESETLLAMEVPLAVRSDRAGCEVQFGVEHRPTHRNTSWDDAKFEVCAQRFVDISEPSFGVAVCNDGRWGHAVQDGGVRVSLLRSARYPDPGADAGHHRCTLSILPHGPGLADVVTAAEELNTPLRVVEGATGAADRPVAAPPAVLAVADRRVAVSAVKHADDGSGDLVVRLWEATGDHVATGIRLASPVAGAALVDVLEDGAAPLPPGCTDEVAVDPDDATLLHLRLGPFRMATVRLQAQVAT